MSTSFNFPANPTLNQIVVLPDGNSAQWNGYAWVSVANNVTYPLAITNGGTGATNATTARVNLGLDTATGERIIPKDGTALLPALAWAGEPGLGWYRPAAGRISMAAQGGAPVAFTFDTAASTTLGLYPRAAGTSAIYLVNRPPGGANYSFASISAAADGTASLATAGVGTGPRGNLFLDAPQTLLGVNGTAALPSFGWASEPGTGFYRRGAQTIGFTASGVDTGYLTAVDATSTQLLLLPRTPGGASVSLINKPNGVADYNGLRLEVLAGGGGYISSSHAGAATQGSLGFRFAQVTVESEGTNANLALIKKAGGNNYLVGQQAATQRWLVNLGDSAPETGGNAGSNFVITNYTDAGVGIDTPFSILRSTGQVNLSQILKAKGYACKAGNSGAFGPESFNMNWSGGVMQLYASDFTPGYIQTVSDERIKQRIVPLCGDEAAYMKIKPISYGFRNIAIWTDDGSDYWGFSAQNLFAAFPKAIRGSITAMHDKDTPEPASVDDRAILAQTVLMVQSLLHRVHQLES